MQVKMDILHIALGVKTTICVIDISSNHRTAVEPYSSRKNTVAHPTAV